MKKLLNIVAGIGLLLTGATATVTATPGIAEAQPGHHARDHRHKGHKGRDWRRGDRRWQADRRWDRDRRWNNDRRWRDDRYGYRGNGRTVYGGSREAAAMGVQYRGPCRYIIRNGRRVCD